MATSLIKLTNAYTSNETLTAYIKPAVVVSTNKSFRYNVPLNKIIPSNISVTAEIESCSLFIGGQRIVIQTSNINEVEVLKLSTGSLEILVTLINTVTGLSQYETATGDIKTTLRFS